MAAARTKILMMNRALCGIITRSTSRPGRASTSAETSSSLAAVVHSHDFDTFGEQTRAGGMCDGCDSVSFGCYKTSGEKFAHLAASLSLGKSKTNVSRVT